MKTFILFDHQGKSAPFASALKKHDYLPVNSLSKDASFVLADSDVLGRGFALNKISVNVPVFVYPHSAFVPVFWDGMYPVHKKTTAVFVSTKRQAEILRRYGFPRPALPVGFSFCPQRPFRPFHGDKPKVLFAPIHPNRNGYLPPQHKDANTSTFTSLVRLAKAGIIDLKVRIVGSMTNNGLWPSDFAEFVHGETNQSHTDIDKADCVVGKYTFAYMAVARGVPTVMMNEKEPPVSDNGKDPCKHPRRWEAYRELVEYPYSIENLNKASDVEKVLSLAMGTEASEWRRGMIGRDFNGNRFVHVVEELCHGQ